MKRKSGFLLLHGQTFPYDVLVALGATRDELLSHFGAKYAPLHEDEKEELQMIGKGRTVRLKSGAFVLWTKEFPNTPEHFGYLAHEIFHTADLMLRRAGATLSDDSDEVWAYQIDWLTKNIYSSFKLAA
jgi:hypothetical protein